MALIAMDWVLVVWMLYVSATCLFVFLCLFILVVLGWVGLPVSGVGLGGGSPSQVSMVFSCGLPA